MHFRVLHTSELSPVLPPLYPFLNNALIILSPRLWEYLCTFKRNGQKYSLKIQLVLRVEYTFVPWQIRHKSFCVILIRHPAAPKGGLGEVKNVGGGRGVERYGETLCFIATKMTLFIARHSLRIQSI